MVNFLLNKTTLMQIMDRIRNKKEASHQIGELMRGFFYFIGSHLLAHL